MVMAEYLDYVAEQREIIIYGTGKIGLTVYHVLEENGLEQKIKYFVSTGAKDGEKMGIPVKNIYDLDTKYYENALFLVCVSDKFLDEMEAVLKELQVKNWMDGRYVYAGEFQKDAIQKKLLQQKVERYELEEEHQPEAKNKETVAHITYCFVKNAGDTMLSKCVRKTIGASEYRIIGVDKPIDDEVLREINQCDYLVLGGGGLFLPDTNANEVSGWQWAISKEQLEQIQIPIIVYSVGYNFFKGQSVNELFRESVANLVEKAAFVGLRNHGSIAAVREIVPESLREKIVYQPCTTTVIQKLYGIEKEKNSRIVGINMAFDREEQRYGADKTKILNQVAAAAKKIERMGYQIRYIAHCDTDLRFLPYLRKQGVTYEVVYLGDSFPDEIIECYRDVQLMMGMRGHAQMIPFGVGCRIISMGTHDKMRWFLEDIDAADWYIDLNEEPACLTEKICRVFERVNQIEADETDRRLCAAQEKLWELTCQNRQTIAEIVKQEN